VSLRSIVRLLPMALSVVGGLFARRPGGAQELKIGDAAPEFTLPGSDGQTHALSDLRGKAVVLAWFPKAFTGG
jgi:peroxiredoxin Q/BCP